MDRTLTRRRWPRLTLVLSPETSEALQDLARENLRDRRTEALRLVLEGLEREDSRRAGVASARDSGR